MLSIDNLATKGLLRTFKAENFYRFKFFRTFRNLNTNLYLEEYQFDITNRKAI